MMDKENEENYHNALLDKIMGWKSLPNYADSALRYFAESELNPGLEDQYLQKAQVLATLELARVVNLINQK